jgi:hypothetical protein
MLHNWAIKLELETNNNQSINHPTNGENPTHSLMDNIPFLGLSCHDSNSEFTSTLQPKKKNEPKPTLRTLLIHLFILLHTADTRIAGYPAEPRRSFIHLIGVAVAHVRGDGLGADRHAVLPVPHKVVVAA